MKRGHWGSRRLNCVLCYKNIGLTELKELDCMTIYIARQGSLIAGLAVVCATAILQVPLLAAAIAPVPGETGNPGMPKPAASKIQQLAAASLMDQLKLTSEQKQKIATLRRTRTVEINKVLTPAQKVKFEAARKAGKSTSESMMALGLKPDQKKKIVEIAKKSADAIMGVLDSTQQKQVAAYLKARKSSLE
jgi:Spy/CpxP family protein refolding chaperone